MKRSKRKALPKSRKGKLLEELERAKASIRTKVEHPFYLVKNLVKYRKTRYRGTAKYEEQFFSLFGLTNLFLARTVVGTARAKCVLMGHHGA